MGINRNKNRLFLIIALGVSLFFMIKPAEAATSTVRGKAWWTDQYKYITFDCLDDVTGDRLDDPGNLFALPVPQGFHFNSEPCVNLVHHVYIDDSNRFSGQAWNYSKGLISFDEDAPDYSFNLPAAGNCSTCTAANNCSACYNEAQQKVYGYAKIMSDGTFIRLDSTSTRPVRLQTWDLSNSIFPGHGILPGDFIGTASSPSGDLSFNCLTEGGDEGNCAARNYKVYVADAQIGHLSAPNWNYQNACEAQSALKAYLYWNLKSGTQSGFEVVVSKPDTNNFSTSTGNYTCWSGVKNNSSASQYVIPNISSDIDPNCGSLAYGKNYYWWIRLYYDNDTKVTKWYQYGANDGHDGNSDEETQGDPDGNQLTFTTYKHEFPIPYFNWDPEEIIVGTSTEFSSIGSKYYSVASPNLPQSCAGANCRYLWTSDTGVVISSTTSATTSIIFTQSATSAHVTLFVTDIDNYVCSTSSIPLSINYGLPVWREIKAK